MNFLTQNKGQLLMESMIAISIITVGLLGVFALLSQSQSLNRVLSDRYVATYLAVEGIEIVKNKLDSNINAGNDWYSGLGNGVGGTYSIDYTGSIIPQSAGNLSEPLEYNEATGTYSISGGSQTSFIRKVTIEYPSADEMKINSIIGWTTRGGGQFDINLEAHFYNWRQPLPSQPL